VGPVGGDEVLVGVEVLLVIVMVFLEKGLEPGKRGLLDDRLGELVLAHYAVAAISAGGSSSLAPSSGA
jgi:hypothetical protein